LDPGRITVYRLFADFNDAMLLQPRRELETSAQKSSKI
jgi:hypothetical protein